MRTYFAWICLIISLHSNLAHSAAVTISSVSGASAFKSTSGYFVYAGLGGPDCTSRASSTSATCNSCDPTYFTCATTPLCPCNTARTYDSLVMRLEITPPANYEGGNALLYKDTTLLNIQNDPANNGQFIEVTWSNICNQVNTNPSTNCATVAAGTVNSVVLKVYLDTNKDLVGGAGDDVSDVTFKIIDPEAIGDTNNIYGVTNTNGVGNFTPYPGDEKVYLDPIDTSTNFATTLGYGNTRATAIRVFSGSFSDGGMSAAVPSANGTFTDLAVSDDGTEVTQTIVSGLTNGTPYAFRVATVDEAGNAALYFPDLTASGFQTQCTTNLGQPGCPYGATPSEVLGLLTNDFNCFIATAAYGTQLEPKLEVFRKFRQRFLLPYSWGRKFINSYYHYGPYAARFIADKPWLQFLTRLALWPVYAFSYAALKFGAAWTFVGAITALGLLLSLPIYGRNRRRNNV
jgi:hypothetical protein